MQTARWQWKPNLIVDMLRCFGRIWDEGDKVKGSETPRVTGSGDRVIVSRNAIAEPRIRKEVQIQNDAAIAPWSRQRRHPRGSKMLGAKIE